MIWSVSRQMIITYLFNKWSPNVHHSADKSPPLNPILRQLNPFQNFTPNFSKINVDIVLPGTPF